MTPAPISIARNATGPKLMAWPMVCAASDTASPNMATVQATSGRVRSAQAPGDEHAGARRGAQAAQRRHQKGYRHRDYGARRGAMMRPDC